MPGRGFARFALLEMVFSGKIHLRKRNPLGCVEDLCRGLLACFWRQAEVGLLPFEGRVTPLECRGHALPCVRRVVEKAGAKNYGRAFLSCRYWRDKGGCGHFAWVS